MVAAAACRPADALGSDEPETERTTRADTARHRVIERAGFRGDLGFFSGHNDGPLRCFGTCLGRLWTYGPHFGFVDKRPLLLGPEEAELKLRKRLKNTTGCIARPVVRHSRICAGGRGWDWKGDTTNHSWNIALNNTFSSKPFVRDAKTYELYIFGT